MIDKESRVPPVTVSRWDGCLLPRAEIKASLVPGDVARKRSPCSPTRLRPWMWTDWLWVGCVPLLCG